MKAMILAAGRGERMRPLTDHQPKPLIPVGGKPLIDWHLERLRAAGLREVVVNLGWQGEKLAAHLGDGQRWGLQIAISREGWPALETGGGLWNARALLGPEPFLLVNGDVFCDVDFADLSRTILAPDDLAHLVLVENPTHHPQGDFGLADGRATLGAPRYTFSGVSLLRIALLDGAPAGAFPLAPWLVKAIAAGRVAARHHRGQWSDIGTPERLAALEATLRPSSPEPA